MKENLEKENKTGKNVDGPHPNMPVKILTAKSIIGDIVENKAGEKIGEIKDIMLDVHDWHTQYIVLESGGFLGIGEKLFAIPAAALQINPKKQCFILDVDKKFMSTAPGFDKNHWPETNSHYYEIDSHWGNFMGPSVG